MMVQRLEPMEAMRPARESLESIQAIPLPSFACAVAMGAPADSDGTP